jgi:hypothetical protein
VRTPKVRRNNKGRGRIRTRERQHYVNNCPLKQKLNSLKREKKPSIGVLHVLNVVMEGESVERKEKDDIKICYVKAKLNRNSLLAMVDSGAMYNFLREDMVRRLRL